MCKQATHKRPQGAHCPAGRQEQMTGPCNQQMLKIWPWMISSAAYSVRMLGRVDLWQHSQSTKRAVHLMIQVR
jgi:hypothetical protein